MGSRSAFSLISPQATWQHRVEPTGPNPAPPTTFWGCPLDLMHHWSLSLCVCTKWWTVSNILSIFISFLWIQLLNGSPTYGVVPKGLLTFRGSLHKEVRKTTPGTLVYRFERQTARKIKSSFQKHCVLNLECRILPREPLDSFILYFNVIFHGK